MSHILDTIVDDQNQQSEFTQLQDQDQDLTKSTFIAFLRYEKMSNRTLDFKQIFADVEPLSYSHALIVLNQAQIVKNLLKHLKLKNSQNLSPTVLASNTRTQCISLDLLICLIKDLRSDIYEQFLSLILPASISVIDTQNIMLLDKIFTLISFALKYLIKNIKQDIQRFFKVYVELVQHKNRHLRKFASQGLSYVLRKYMGDQDDLKQAIQVINFAFDKNENEMSLDLLHGISDVYFEMMYGASEDLYSNSSMLIDELLEIQVSSNIEESNFAGMLRLLFVKLFNNIDSEKQLPIFEALKRKFDKLFIDFTQNQFQGIKNLELIILIIQDSIKLKFGRRLNHVCVIQILEIFNNIFEKNVKTKVKLIDLLKNQDQLIEIISVTLSQLYYIKNQTIQQIFFQSKIDITNQKTIFNYSILQIENKSCIKNYFQIFMKDAAEITQDLQVPYLMPKVVNGDFGSLIGLKQQTYQSQMLFTQESHQVKLGTLMPKFNQHIQKQIQEGKEEDFQLQVNITVFNQLFYILTLSGQDQQTQKHSFKIFEITKLKIVQILQKLVKNISDEQMDEQLNYLMIFNILKYLSILKYEKENEKNKEYNDILLQLQNLNANNKMFQQKKISIFKQFPALQKYPQFISQNEYSNGDQILQDFIDGYFYVSQNQDKQNISQKINILSQYLIVQSMFTLQDTNESNLKIIQSQQLNSLIKTISNKKNDIFTLTIFQKILVQASNNNQLNNEQLEFFSVQNNNELFKSLSQNLKKGSKQLRIISLSILQYFKVLNFVKPDEKKQQNDIQFFNNENQEYQTDRSCNCLKIMYEFEKTEIGFEHEKSKIMQIQRLEVMLKSGVVPNEYLQTIYNFLIGCLWIKFTPLFESINNCISILIHFTKDDQIRESFVLQHSNILQSSIWLSQIIPRQDKSQLIDLITSLQIQAEEKLIEDEFIFKNLNESESVQDLKEMVFQNDQYQENILQINDFFSQICKSLSGCLSSILKDKKSREIIFQTFYNFFDYEYNFFVRKIVIQNEIDDQIQIEDQQNLIQQITSANQNESSENKAVKHQAMNTLNSIIELLKSADSLKQVPNIQKLQEVLYHLLSSTDNKSQKTALECLIKTGYKQGLLKKYTKLLEGFCDDEKFKDMVPIMTYGSQNMSGDADVVDEYYQLKEDDKLAKKLNRKETKSTIPKLEVQDRQQVLPVIVKILQSKLIQKKGQINKKSLYVRRNILFQFFATFDPESEFIFVVNELLESVNLSYNDLKILQKFKLQWKISNNGFNNFLTFVNQLEIMVKQMGKFLNNYIQGLSYLLVQGVVSMAKAFLKEQKSENMNNEIIENLEGEQEDSEDEQNTQLNVNSKKQAKNCIRKSLGLALQIYNKFYYKTDFISEFSNQIYEEIIQDQLDIFSTCYISEKSQILQIICQSWALDSNTLDNYLKYPNVLPSIFKMLSHPSVSYEVVEIQFSLLKKLIGDTINLSNLSNLKAEGHQDQITRIEAIKDHLDTNIQQEIDNENIDNQIVNQNNINEEQKLQEISQQILEQNIYIISQNLYQFWYNKNSELKKVIGQRGIKNKGSYNGKNIKAGDKATQMKIDQLQKIQVKKFHAAKDILFIISELSNYLIDDENLNFQFLEMIVEIMAIKNIQQNNLSNFNLLCFGSKSISNLIPKVQEGQISHQLLDKIFQLFLHVDNPKVRQTLSQGLQQAFCLDSYKNAIKHQNLVSQQSLQTLSQLNKVKRGLADLELDCDQIIQTIQVIIDQKLLDVYSLQEIQIITYCTIFLIKHSEYSIREYSTHFFNYILKKLIQRSFSEVELHPLFVQIENQIIKVYLNTVKDELILKSILECLRSLVIFVKQCDMNSQYHLSDLYSLCESENQKNVTVQNLGDQSSNKEKNDFFSNILSIKLKKRQKCLKQLREQIDLQQFNNSNAFERVILPLIDFITLGGKDQLQNQRNTVSYNKEHQRDVLDNALDIYQSFSAQLNWSNFFKQIKRYLYKLHRTDTSLGKSTSNKADTSPELMVEKLITKVICKLMNGFKYESIPDAVEETKLKNNQNLALTDAKEFRQDLQQMFGKKIKINIEKESDSEESCDDEISSDSDQEILNQENIEMKTPEQQDLILIEKIQEKLKKQILPIIQKHLTEEGTSKGISTKGQDSKHFRAFAVVCYAKAIRKLQVRDFNIHLRRLVNSLVVHGLRSRELSYREKARKALIKLIDEITPFFLSVVCEEMKNQLTRGYQEHVYLYSMYNILQGLHNSGALENSGSITQGMIEQNMDVLLSELFGEINEEKTNEQNNQIKVIKEAKTRKAIPVFEIFSQHLDFNQSFPSLIIPIIKVLQQSPTLNKIQKCEDLLSRISSAILNNKSIQSSQLLAYIYSIIDQGVSLSVKIKINDDKQKRDYGSTVDQIMAEAEQKNKKLTSQQAKYETLKVQMYWLKGFQTVNDKKTQEISGRVLATFGLQCLKKALKEKKIINLQFQDESDQLKKETVELLDPFVLVLLNSFKTYHNPIVINTLNIISQIIVLDLPSFQIYSKKLLNRIFKLFNNQISNQADSDFTNSLFKCIQELITRCIPNQNPNAQKQKQIFTQQIISEVQLKTLIKIVSDNLEKFAVQSNALQVLRAIVKKRFICTEIYDIVEDKIQEMMISNNLKNIRDACSDIFVQFILDYPLENSRIEQHLSFILKNISFGTPSGRISVLQTLDTLICKFPKQIIDLYAELLFFTLLLRTVNEDDQNCRLKVFDMLQTLIGSGKISGDKMKVFFNSIFKLGNDKLMNNQQDNSSQKVKLLILAKINGFQVFCNIKQYFKTNEIKKIMNECYQLVIQKEYEDLEQIIKNAKSDQKNEQSLNEQTNQYDQNIQKFLKAIELDEDINEEQINEEEEQGSNHNQIVLFQALKIIENILINQDIKSSIIEIGELGLPNIFLIFSQFHSSYWIRLISQRILGHIFAFQTNDEVKSKNPLFQNLGLEVPEQFIDWPFKLANCLYKPLKSQQLQEQFVKNMIFMLNQLITNQEYYESEQKSFQIQKLFNKISFIGRKTMLDIKTSSETLQAIMLFFKISLDLFASMEDKKQDLFMQISQAILNLTVRLSTDIQYSSEALLSIKQNAIDINETIQINLGKIEFLNQYNITQKGIQQKRFDRKQKQKIILASGSNREENGAKLKNRKRERKLEKKKDKQIQRLFLEKHKY